MGWVGGLPPAPINPDGGGITGGLDIYLPSGTSYAYTLDRAEFSSFFAMEGFSEALTETTIDITGYGTREGYSENITVSTLDIGFGLTVINEGGIVTTNTNVLRFLGNDIYSGATYNKSVDATVTTDPRIVIDGGDSPTRTDAEVIEGGTAADDNADLDGGNAT